jgi:hypothetical protein
MGCNYKELQTRHVHQSVIFSNAYCPLHFLLPFHLVLVPGFEPVNLEDHQTIALPRVPMPLALFLATFFTLFT